MLEIHPSMDSIRTLGILNGPKEQHDSALRVPDHEQEGPIDVHFKGRVYRGRRSGTHSNYSGSRRLRSPFIHIDIGFVDDLFKIDRAVQIRQSPWLGSKASITPIVCRTLESSVP